MLCKTHISCTPVQSGSDHLLAVFIHPRYSNKLLAKVLKRLLHCLGPVLGFTCSSKHLNQLLLVCFQSMEAEKLSLELDEEEVTRSPQNTISIVESMVGRTGDADQKRVSDKTTSCVQFENINCELRKESVSKLFMEKNRGKLDVFEDMYESWQTNEENLEYENKSLNQRIESYEELQKISKTKIVDLNKTVELLEASVSALHNELNIVENLQRENSDLKSKLNVKEQLMKSLKSELEAKENEYKSKLCNMEKEQKIKIQNLETENRRLIDDLKSQQNDIIKQKNKEVSDLKLRIEEVEKDKQSELVCMSVDYDNKLAKIHRQRAAASLNQQHPSMNQEIFRKKLQHLKSEYEREINSLKEQVASLKSQLPAIESPRQSRSLFTMGPLAKKIKKQ